MFAYQNKIRSQKIHFFLTKWLKNAAGNELLSILFAYKFGNIIDFYHLKVFFIEAFLL